MIVNDNGWYGFKWLGGNVKKMFVNVNYRGVRECHIINVV